MVQSESPFPGVQHACGSNPIPSLTTTGRRKLETLQPTTLTPIDISSGVSVPVSLIFTREAKIVDTIAHPIGGAVGTVHYQPMSGLRGSGSPGRN